MSPPQGMSSRSLMLFVNLPVGFVLCNLAIDYPSVTDLDDPDGQLIALDGVDDSIVPLADPETIQP